MGIRVFNTLTGRKDEFKPLNAGKVGMYVCGPTVYDDSHIGHARAAIVFDVIFRYLKFREFEVTYVRNYTDVDDKIIRKAELEGVPAAEIAERYTRSYDEDMEALGVEKPTVTPRVSDHIPDIIEMVKTLVDKGYAYASGGDVFYSVRKFPGYGRLSGQSLDEIRAGARVDVNEDKDDPADFALWKGAKPGEPHWSSPWGEGRPGWHIECSVMSGRYLGKTFDIHGGGKDLIFPHHENEIAQSEAANEKQMARYWIHNGFVNINKEKMSKSLGNFFTIKQILEKYHPEVIRLFLFSAHYRSPVDFSEQNLTEAEINLDRFYEALARIKELVGSKGEKAEFPTSGPLAGVIAGLDKEFRAAMDDDFNTALAMARFHDALRAVNQHLNDPEFLKKQGTVALLENAGQELVRLGRVLGIFQEDPGAYIEKKQALAMSGLKISEAEIEKIIQERAEARKQKDFKKADALRAKLLEQGISLEDTAKGTIWKVR
jgi:cysteinyl-tRNA synthetase